MSDRDEKARLAALASYGLLDTPPDPRLDAIVQEAAERFGASAATITLVDQHRQWFKARHGVEVRETPIAASICAHAILQPDVLVVEDACADARFRHFSDVIGALHLRFYAGAPLTLRCGTPVGTLCIFDPVARTDFDEDDRAMLVQLARRAVAEFELERDRDRNGAAPLDLMSEREWLEHAHSLMGRASAALERCEAVAELAYLEAAIDGIGRRRGTIPA